MIFEPYFFHAVESSLLSYTHPNYCKKHLVMYIWKGFSKEQKPRLLRNYVLRIPSRKRDTFTFKTHTSMVKYTKGCNTLHTLLVKYYNDLLDKQSSKRGRDEVTYLLLCWDVFGIIIGPMYADFFQEKIFTVFSGRKFQTFYCRNVITMKSLELSPRNFPLRFFFLKIGIHRAPRYIQKTSSR